MIRRWRCIDKSSHYYFQEHDGRIVGQTYNIAFTIVWGAKIPINATEDLHLGQYIELEFAKRAIEEYWNEKDRTFDVFNEVTNKLVVDPRPED